MPLNEREKITDLDITGAGERLITKTSVSVLLGISRSRRIVLVRQSQGGQWGLPAGGIKPRELLIPALRREVREETNIPEENLYFDPRPHVVCLPEADKTHVGLVFHGDVINMSPPAISGWKVLGDAKVNFAKPFSPREIFRLIENPKKIYRSEFNFHQLMRWLTMASEVHEGEQIRYIDEWFERMVGVVAGLSITENTILADFRRWKYTPPYVVEQNPLDKWGIPVSINWGNRKD